MTDDADNEVMSRVRRALGRSGGEREPQAAPPAPPALPDSVVRLVRDDVDLAKLFAQRAAELKMIVTPVTANTAAEQLVKFISAHPIKKIALAVSPLLERLKLREALEASPARLTVKTWDELTLDELYD